MEAQQAAGPRTVRVTAKQLREKSLPAVCAMTGTDGEVWRKFRFATLPNEAWWARGVFSALSERSVTGYLPLTARSDRTLTQFTIAPVAVVAVGTVLAFAGAIVGLEVALFIGLLLVGIGGVGVLLSRPFVGPQGRVLFVDGETVVQLTHVSVAFVTAVEAMHRRSEAG